MAEPSIRDAALPAAGHALLFRDGRIFCLRRAGTGLMDGFWTLPAGRVEPGETPSECAERECLEEAGVVAIRTDPTDAGGSTRHVPDAAGTPRPVFLWFESFGFSGEPMSAEPHKSEACGWFLPNKLPDPFIPWQVEPIGRIATAAARRQIPDPRSAAPKR